VRSKPLESKNIAASNAAKKKDKKLFSEEEDHEEETMTTKKISQAGKGNQKTIDGQSKPSERLPEFPFNIDEVN
jgi:hypothetical protein